MRKERFLAAMSDQPMTNPDFLAYARQGDEEAFRRIVHRHLGLVRGTALRTLHTSPHLADDVAQTVFLRLARKATGLPINLNVPLWLHQQAVWITKDMYRAEIRRRNREIMAHRMREEPQPGEPDVTALSPWIDREMLHLPPSDREAILLRYFQNLSLQQVGSALGVTASTAQKRVERAVDKLRIRLQGVVKHPLTTTSLVTFLLLEESKAQAAVPPLLAQTIITQSLSSPPSLFAPIFTAMVTTKSILIGAAAGGILAAIPLLLSDRPHIASGSGTHAGSNHSANPPSDPFSLPSPASAKEPAELLRQVAMILSSPDTELTRTRLEAYLMQLNADQLAALFQQADQNASDTLVARLYGPLLKHWVPLDGEAAMLACEAARKDRSVEDCTPDELLKEGAIYWVNSHFDDAMDWLVKNQDRTSVTKISNAVLLEASKIYAAKSPQKFIAWARQLQGDELIDSVIEGAYLGISEAPEQDQGSAFMALFESLRKEEDPHFAATGLRSLFAHGDTYRYDMMEAELAKKLAQIPDTQGLLWQLIASNSERTLKGLAEVYPPQKVEEIVAQSVLSLDSLDKDILFEPNNFNKSSDAMTGPRRDELLGHVTDLMISMAKNPSAGSSRKERALTEALRWASKMENDTRRSQLLEQILGSIPEEEKTKLIPAMLEASRSLSPDIQQRIQSMSKRP